MLIKNKAKKNRFEIGMVSNEQQLTQCLQLRYDIFANELGANLEYNEQLDIDRFDEYCKHLMIIDNTSGNVIATTRLLSDLDTVNSGGFYSETEFDISSVLDMPGRFMEVGRTCIHQNYRKSIVLALLWHGISRIVEQNKINYLIGCVSLPLSSDVQYLSSLMSIVRKKHFSDYKQRATPLVPFNLSEQQLLLNDLVMPPLLRGYLNQGALICGEPYWDAEFSVADLFVLLDCENISLRYLRHFMNKKQA